MRKTILLLLCCIASAFAQNTILPPGELSVSGTASAKVAPDEITFNLKVSKEQKAEAEALKQLNAELDALQQYISKSGIPVKQVKITDYSVISVTLKKSTEKAFVASATLSAQMKLDYKIADKVYTELQSGRYEDIEVDYYASVSEYLSTKMRDTLEKQAIANAKLNAENMAKEFGVKISGIKSINKNVDRNSNGVPDELTNYIDADYVSSQTIFTKFEVAEHTLTEYVSVVYFIKN